MRACRASVSAAAHRRGAAVEFGALRWRWRGAAGSTARAGLPGASAAVADGAVAAPHSPGLPARLSPLSAVWTTITV
eukprot:355498-Chlamydomonas_euryale.AAC.2